MKRTATFTALIALLGTAGCLKQYTELYPFQTSVKLRFEEPERVVARLSTVPVWRDDRVDRVEEMFREVGCKELFREDVQSSPTPNVVCRLRGRTRRTIVVAAHHVLAKGGKGVVDDWSGTALLPSLYASLAGMPHEHSYEFVAFASTTLAGDASYQKLKRMEQGDLNNVVAMIWLNFLGTGPMASWPSRSDPNLRVDLESAAKSIGIEVEARNLFNTQGIHDHSKAYRWFNIPTLFVHSVNIDTQRFLRDPKWDRDPADLDHEAYFETYRVLAVFLSYLDRTAVARRM